MSLETKLNERKWNCPYCNEEMNEGELIRPPNTATWVMLYCSNKDCPVRRVKIFRK